MSQIFRLKDIYYGIRKHLSVVVGMTIGGLVIGVMIFVLQSFSSSNVVSYQIFSSFSVSTSNYAGVYINGMDTPGMGDFELADELYPAVAYICRSQKVCEEAVSRSGLLGVQVGSLQKALTLSQQGNSSVVEIKLRWNNREEGLQLLQTVLDVLPEAMQDVLKVGGIQIIEPPVATEITTNVSMSIIITLTLVGFLIGMLYCFSQLYLHPTLIEIRDVNELFGVNLLSDIPEEADFPTYLDRNLITNRDDLPSGFRESYTALAHIILHQMDDDHFCLFVTSAARGEGKTTVVSNLGLELAALDKRVLLIDFDLSSPSLGSCFLDDVDYMHSINAVYFDETSAREAIIKINENLDILPAKLDKRHIGVNRFAKKLVAQMQEEYDIVLLDTEPVGESSEMLYFSNVSDSALFVIRYDFTPCDQIESSIEKLQKTNATIQGAIANRVAHLGIGRSGGKEIDRSENGEKENQPKAKAGKKKKRAEAAAEIPENADDDSDLMDGDSAETAVAPEAQPQKKDKKRRKRRDDADVRAGSAKNKKTQPAQIASEDEDDSDLMDDALLEQFLMRAGKSQIKRRDQAMLRDDDHEDGDPSVGMDAIRRTSAEKKPAEKVKARNTDSEKDADYWERSEPAKPSTGYNDWDNDEF